MENRDHGPKQNPHEEVARKLSEAGVKDRLLSPAEAAAFLGSTIKTIYTKAYRRELPSVKVGRSLRFRLSSLERIVKAAERPALRPLREAPPADAEGGAA